MDKIHRPPYLCVGQAHGFPEDCVRSACICIYTGSFEFTCSMERRIYERPRAELLAVAVEEGIAVSSPESVSGTHEDVTLDGGYEY